MSGTTDGPNGIDISKWQTDTPSLAGLEFVIARASIGTTTDPMYNEHIFNAKQAGLLTGAYHFNWPTLSVADQVRTFLRKAGNVDFYFIDVEKAASGMGQFTRAQTREFIKRVRDAGKSCGLYMSESNYYTDVDNDYRWVANWSQPPSIAWKFWQYQGSPLDKNRFNGSLTELRALASTGEIEMTPLPISSEEPRLVSKTTKTNFYDLDGDTIVRTADSLGPDRYSMYGAGPLIMVDGKQESEFRAVNSAGRVLLVRPATYKPVPDTTPHDDADIARAVAAQQAADQAEIDSAYAARDEALTQVATAAAEERERIALALGQEEAERVRSTAP